MPITLGIMMTLAGNLFIHDWAGFGRVTTACPRFLPVARAWHRYNSSRVHIQRTLHDVGFMQYSFQEHDSHIGDGRLKPLQSTHQAVLVFSRCVVQY